MSAGIKHLGTVVEVRATLVGVRVEVNSACSGCHARSVCGVDESQERIIRVETPRAAEYKVGDSVEVALNRESMGTLSVVLSYIVPFFVLMIVLVATTLCGVAEGLTALLSLLSVGLYYLGLWLVRDKIKGKIKFNITKLTK